MDYLKEISKVSFPQEIMGEAPVDKLRILHSAGMIEMEWIPGAAHAVRVLSLTGRGRAIILADTAQHVLHRRKSEPSSAWMDLE